MSVIYVGISTAKAGQAEQLKNFYEEKLVSDLSLCQGLESGSILQGVEDPHKFTVIEKWKSQEVYEAVANTMTQNMKDEQMSLVTDKPLVNHYSDLV